MLSPGESDTLDGISRAFFAALDQDSSELVLGVWGTLALAAAYAFCLFSIDSLKISI